MGLTPVHLKTGSNVFGAEMNELIVLTEWILSYIAEYSIRCEKTTGRDSIWSVELSDKNTGAPFGDPNLPVSGCRLSHCGRHPHCQT
ncbi:unnamed protein product [Protopolystoma xenopodis]|uniref:Uncharacterized protein n=1 Tax=Protopolystoma xenopodis TaxID=117903 RepID=A0A3S5CMX8_9PLAT|nr:unnamed protein product [Protopolystoma xenopodis]